MLRTWVVIWLNPGDKRRYREFDSQASALYFAQRLNSPAVKIKSYLTRENSNA